MGFYHVLLHRQDESWVCPHCGGSRFRRIRLWHPGYSWAALIRFTVFSLSMVVLWFHAMLPRITGLTAHRIIAMLRSGEAFRGHLLPVLALSTLISYLYIAFSVRNFYPAKCTLRAYRCRSCFRKTLVQYNASSAEEG